MKATGIIRYLDTLGRISIPKELRTRMSIHDRTPLEIMVDGDSIVLTKYRPACACCGRVDVPMMRTGEMRICKRCYGKFKEEDTDE